MTGQRGLSVFLAACLFLLAGCSGQTGAGQGDSESESPTAAETITGKIKEINGNEILLAIGEVDNSTPGGPAGESAPQGEWQAFAGAQNTPGGSEQPVGEQGAGSGGRPSAGNQEGGPGGEGRQQRSAGGRSGGLGGGNALGTDVVSLTGQEETYLIPVTATVTTGQGEGARTIRFTQLAVKNVIRLDLDELGNILRVEVLQ